MKAITEKRHGICPKAFLNSHMSYWVLLDTCLPGSKMFLPCPPFLLCHDQSLKVPQMVWDFWRFNPLWDFALGIKEPRNTEGIEWNWILYIIYKIYSFKFLSFNIARNRYYYYILLSLLASWEATIHCKLQHDQLSCTKCMTNSLKPSRAAPQS